MILQSQVREGSLVGVKDGPLRVSSDDHNFGIVVAIRLISGEEYAEVVTNTGHHRMITPDRLDVYSQSEEESSAF